jgi:hypothetical protein
VSTTNQVQIVFFVEALNHFGNEHVADTAFVLPPGLGFLLRVTPEEIAEKSMVGDISGSVETLYLFEVVKLGA